MDPFSVTAGIAGLLSLTVQLTQILLEYTSSVKNAVSESYDLTVELKALVTVLRQLERFLEGQAPSGRFRDSSIIYSTTKACHGKLHALDFVLKKFMDGTRDRSKLWQRCVKWPLEKQEHQQTVDTVRHCVHIFQFSISINGWELVSDSADELKTIHQSQADHSKEVTRIIGEVAVSIHQGHADQSKMAARILSEVAALNCALEDVSLSSQSKLDILLEKKSDSERHDVLSWICKNSDPSTHHNNATRAREPETGLWFLESENFQDWTKHSKFLWLYGIPGCGKTVLCSTIIEAMKTICEQSTTHTMAYFYFNFQDIERQDLSTMLRSLIRQLCAAEINIPDSIKALHNRCRDSNHSPTLEELTTAVFSISIESQKHVYVIIDALDEFPESNGPLRRSELLNLIERLAKENIENLHVLVTSRAEMNIIQVLENLTPRGIPLQSRTVDPDIKALVSSRLMQGRFAGLPDSLKKEVEEKVGNGAHGMFRWATCQLDILAKCKKVGDIKRALSTLPKTLDDTYARILAQIDEEYKEDARSILRWLAFSARRMRLDEIAEAAVVRPTEEPLDPDDRLTDVSEVLRICSSFVTLESDDVFSRGRYAVVRFAHFSVLEYLLSRRAGPFSISADSSHDYIGGCCVSYLLQFNGPLFKASTPSSVDFPLLEYAANRWQHHVRTAEVTELNTCLNLCYKFFSPEYRTAFANYRDISLRYVDFSGVLRVSGGEVSDSEEDDENF